jgi:DNA-binding protein HU-beta
MNLNELADQIAASHDLTKTQARAVVAGVFDSIAAAASKGDEVSVAGFGKFKVTDRPAREGRNPSTGATIQIAASKKIGFTAAKALKDKLG